jgi:hypothetical protein
MNAPRWTLCEYWVQGKDLLICCANLRQKYDGGPITIKLGKSNINSVVMHTLLKSGMETISVSNGSFTIKNLEHFCAISIRSYFE